MVMAFPAMDIPIIGIRDTIIHDKSGWRRIRMTEEARQYIIANCDNRTLNMIEIPVLHTDTHLCFFDFDAENYKFEWPVSRITMIRRERIKECLST
jgi:hypothetical protein